MKYSKLMILFFFIILLIFSQRLLSSRNQIIDISPKDVDYVEIIQFRNNTMRTIQDPSSVKDIISTLNRLRGKVTQKDNSVENTNYINIYTKRGNKIEIMKSGMVLRVNNQWYNLSKGSSDLMDDIFRTYISIS